VGEEIERLVGGDQVNKSRLSLWLILLSQVLILISGLIASPSSPVKSVIQVGLPLLVIACVALMLAGVIPTRKK
jgi:hypothetical protein